MGGGLVRLILGRYYVCLLHRVTDVRLRKQCMDGYAMRCGTVEQLMPISCYFRLQRPSSDCH